MADDAFDGVGGLVFTLVISYFGALELFFVARHLYHWSFHHHHQHHQAAAAAGGGANPNDYSLNHLQERVDAQLAAAEAAEAAAGGKHVMQDGVRYADGFRIAPPETKEDKRKEMEAELERQRRLEEETRRQLAEAEAKLAKERELAEAAAKKRYEDEEREREQEQRRRRELEEHEAEENSRKLVEAERRREEEQRRRELENEAEKVNRLFEGERAREKDEREREVSEQAESTRKLVEAEREQELKQRREEEAFEQDSTEESEHEFQSKNLFKAEREQEEKQKLIEENARRFLEAEEEMVVLQQRRQLDATRAAEYEDQVPVVEEPCIKKTLTRHFEDAEPVIQKVKTQFGQIASESPNYSISSKLLVFPGISDEGSSLEPISSAKSSFSTEPSEEYAAATERQEPDGGEDNIPEIKYTDEYLRNLDGIKGRSLMREDGSGRRRAFKKRRSSGSSNSSRESRASREDELKMFTSLEEEELRKGEPADFTPINYSNETSLRVKPHHRRHRRSPAKDAKNNENDNLRGSLEMLGEETTDPWGEIVPEHYKDTEFWKREKAMSIDEEELELEKVSVPGQDVEVEDVEVETKAMPKESSFERASRAQNVAAARKLTKSSDDQVAGAGEREDSKTNACSS